MAECRRGRAPSLHKRECLAGGEGAISVVHCKAPLSKVACCTAAYFAPWAGCCVAMAGRGDGCSRPVGRHARILATSDARTSGRTQSLTDRTMLLHALDAHRDRHPRAGPRLAHLRAFIERERGRLIARYLAADRRTPAPPSDATTRAARPDAVRARSRPSKLRRTAPDQSE